MRKTIFTVAVACLILGTVSSSCIGSFSLSNRLLAWNKTVGNKFLNELVFFAFWVLPVYEVCGLADVLVLNSIEFWSGSNPLAAGTKIIQGNDGKYMVTCDGKGYDIKSLNDGSNVRLDFNNETRAWSYTIDGTTRELFTFVDDTHIQLPVDSTNKGVFEISQAGLLAYQQAAAPALWAAR